MSVTSQIVTGGAGIGAAIVEQLVAAGATAYVWDLEAGVDITERASVEHLALSSMRARFLIKGAAAMCSSASHHG